MPGSRVCPVQPSPAEPMLTGGLIQQGVHVQCAAQHSLCRMAPVAMQQTNWRIACNVRDTRWLLQAPSQEAALLGASDDSVSRHSTTRHMCMRTLLFPVQLPGITSVYSPSTRCRQWSHTVPKTGHVMACPHTLTCIGGVGCGSTISMPLHPLQHPSSIRTPPCPMTKCAPPGVVGRQPVKDWLQATTTMPCVLPSLLSNPCSTQLCHVRQPRTLFPSHWTACACMPALPCSGQLCAWQSV